MSARNMTTLVKSSWKPLVGVVGLAGLMVYASGVCHRKVAGDAIEAPVGRPLQEGASIVAAESVRRAERVELVGTAASDRTVNLSARLAAYVQEVHATAGDRVREGDLLVALDDREIREQLAAAEAQLKQAESEFKRTRQLFDARASTEQALTAAKAAYQSARAQVDRVGVMRSYARVTAPLSGVVTERRVEVGDLASPGQILLSVYDPARMRLEVPVPVRLLGRFAAGEAIDVALDYPARTVRATVEEVVSEIDADSRTRKVKLLIEDDSGDILPGAFGRIAVDDEPHDAVVLPAQAVMRSGQLEMVDVVRDGRAVRRMVRTRAIEGGRVEVLSGLAAGERVAVPAAGS